MIQNKFLKHSITTTLNTVVINVLKVETGHMNIISVASDV